MLSELRAQLSWDEPGVTLAHERCVILEVVGARLALVDVHVEPERRRVMRGYLYRGRGCVETLGELDVRDAMLWFRYEGRMDFPSATTQTSWRGTCDVHEFVRVMSTPQLSMSSFTLTLWDGLRRLFHVSVVDEAIASIWCTEQAHSGPVLEELLRVMASDVLYLSVDRALSFRWTSAQRLRLSVGIAQALENMENRGLQLK